MKTGLVLMSLRSGNGGYDSFDRPIRGFSNFSSTLIEELRKRKITTARELLLPYSMEEKVGFSFNDSKTDLSFTQGKVRPVASFEQVDLTSSGEKILVVNDEWSKCFEDKANKLIVLRTYSLHKNWSFSDVTKSKDMPEFYPRDRILWDTVTLPDRFFMIDGVICVVDIYEKRELSTEVATRRQSLFY